MMAVSVETEPRFKAGVPEVLFEGSYYAHPSDGRQFLMIESGSAKDDAEAGEISPRREIIVVENWFEEIKRFAPVEGN